MVKIHNVKTAIVNGSSYPYHYKRIQCDQCGNSRFRVYIVDPDGSAVYETIFKCQEFLIYHHVMKFIESNCTEDN